MLAVLVAAGGLLGALMVRAVIDLSDERAGLAASVDARIEETGVTHPVTAVLLNFRAYDTWLEMVVLLAVAAAALGSRRGALLPEREGASPGAVLRGLAQRMAPMILLLAVFVLASGTTGPGGAFQAGALLAAGLFLLRLAGFPVFNQAHQSAWRVLLAVGVATFLIAALIGIVLGGAPLRLSPDIAGTAIVLIEVTLTISVVAALFALLVGAVPEDEDHRSHEPDERQTGA